jgi:hypothetical protein
MLKQPNHLLPVPASTPHTTRVCAAAEPERTCLNPCMHCINIAVQPNLAAVMHEPYSNASTASAAPACDACSCQCKPGP